MNSITTPPWAAPAVRAAPEPPVRWVPPVSMAPTAHQAGRSAVLVALAPTAATAAREALVGTGVTAVSAKGVGSSSPPAQSTSTTTDSIRIQPRAAPAERAESAAPAERAAPAALEATAATEPQACRAAAWAEPAGMAATGATAALAELAAMAGTAVRASGGASSTPARLQSTSRLSSPTQPWEEQAAPPAAAGPAAPGAPRDCLAWEAPASAPPVSPRPLRLARLDPGGSVAHRAPKVPMDQTA